MKMFSSRVLTQSLRAAAPRAAASARSRSSIRAYATPATPAATGAAIDSKPPVALFGIDGTYASALYTAATKTSTLDPTARALDALLRAFKSDPHLATILRAPSLTPSDRSQIVEQLLKTSEAGSDKAADTIKRFMKTLAENNRLSALEGVCEKFQTLMGAHRGEVELRVTSAAPLDARVLKQLEQAVGRSQYVGQGKKLKVVPRVQPDIRGGLIVEIGDRTIDLSVSAKMARMNKLLQDTL